MCTSTQEGSSIFLVDRGGEGCTDVILLFVCSHHVPIVSSHAPNDVSQVPSVFPRASHTYPTFFASKFSPFSPSHLCRGPKEKALYLHTQTSILGSLQSSGLLKFNQIILITDCMVPW
jgi:hypothetical protein